MTLALVALAAHGIALAAETAARPSLFDRPGSRFALRPDDAGGPPRTLRGISGVSLAGWNVDRRAAVEAMFESEAPRFRMRPGLDRFAVTRERERRGIHHLRVEQTFRGVPVFGGEYAVAVGAAGDVRMISGRVVTEPEVSTRPQIGVDHALRRARAALGAAVEPFGSRLVVFRTERGSDHLAWELRAEDPATRRQHLALVDAHDGEVLDVQSLSFDLDGRGNVYPVNDRDPLSFVERTLPRLLGETALAGEHTEVHDFSHDDAVGVAGLFPYDTTQSRHLSETSAYWHLDHFGQRLRELGYELPLRTIAYVNGIDPPDGCSVAFANAAGNSLHFFLPCLRLSRNTGNAADIIYHEAQHLVTASYGLWGSDLESRAIHEAYSDYMACTLTGDPNFAEWSLIPCDRNVEHGGAARWLDSDRNTFHYSRRDIVYACYAGYKDPHAVGMILGGAMWDLRRAIGADAADRLAIDALDYLPQTPDFACVADAFLQANYDHHGGRHALAVLRSFLDRGIRGSAEVEIEGPSSLVDGEPGTFEARDCCSIAGGGGTRRWFQRPACDTPECPDWTEIGEGPSIDVSHDVDFDLLLVAEDRWGRTSQDIRRVRVYIGPAPTVMLSNSTWCDRPGAFMTVTAEYTGTPPLSLRWYVVRSYRREELEAGTVVSVSCASQFQGIEARVTDYAGREAAYLITRLSRSAVMAFALEVGPSTPGRSSFSIEAPMAEHARLAVYDVAGREVARPWDGAVPPGRTEVQWTHGVTRPGLYFVRLKTSASTVTRKVLVLP